MARFTRGFTGRRRGDRDPRLPPGQYDAGRSWPVLTAEVTPRLSTTIWSFVVHGLVEREVSWTWDEIRALPESRSGRIPAVAVTAYASLRDSDEAVTAGYNCHLAKPVDPDQLIEAVLAATGLQSKT